MNDDDTRGSGPTYGPPDDPRSGGTGGGGGNGTGGTGGTTTGGSISGTGTFAPTTIPKPTKPTNTAKSPIPKFVPTNPEKIETDPLPDLTPGTILPHWPPANTAPDEQPNGRTDVVVPVTEPVPFIYGAVRCGAQVMYEKVQADGSKVVLWKVCWGPINSLVVNQLDSKPLSSWPGITINYYTGTSSQAVDALMTAAEAGWTSALPGFAYAVAKIPKPQGGGQPAPDVRQVLFDVQGMLVRDPRSDATLVNRFYRDNPALCLADYETNINFGRGRDDAHVDWSGSVTTAANDCDAIIDGVSLKRFTFGLWGGDQKATDEWVTDMRAHAALVVVENSGLWQVWMDKSQAASGIVLSDTGAAANIIAAGPIRVSGGQQVWTRVRVNFTNAANGYKDDYAEDADPRIAIGAVPDIYKEVDLRGITTYDQARRIARYLRKRSGLDKTIPIKVMQDGGIQLLPGIRVPVTAAQIAFSNVDTLITQCTLNTDDGSWDVIVELYDATIYDDSQVSTTSVAPPIQLYGTTYWNQTQLGAAATVNGRVLTGKTSHIVLDVTTAATTLTLDDNIFAVGDRLYLESSPNGVNQTEFMAITAGPTGTGPYTYNVTRDLATTGAKAWRAGEMLFSTGQTGDGFIDLYGTRGVKSASEFGPTIVGNVRNSNTYNDWTPRWAIGNLNGLYGYSSTTYGCAFGVPTGAWVKIDPTNGVRIGFNTTTNVQIDAGGNASFTGAITAASGTIGGWTIGATELVGPSGAAIRSGQTAYNTGTGFFFGNVGGTPKFSIGNSSTASLTWDGSVIAITAGGGNVTIDGSGITVPASYSRGYAVGPTGSPIGQMNGAGSQISIAVANLSAVVTLTPGSPGSVDLTGGLTVNNSSGGIGVGMSLPGAGKVDVSSSYRVNGTKVVGAQGTAIPDTTGASLATVEAEVNKIKAALRASTGHGLIA